MQLIASDGGFKRKVELPLIPKRICLLWIFLLFKTVISTMTYACAREEDILTADK
jgi:hypothetical protein